MNFISFACHLQMLNYGFRAYAQNDSRFRSSFASGDPQQAFSLPVA